MSKRRPRFPPIQKRPDGTKGCRGCGGVIPKGRLTWCSLPCKKKFEPSYVKQAVRDRCGNRCEMCQKDCSRKAINDHFLNQPKYPTYEECKLGWPYDFQKLKEHPLYVEYLEKKAVWKKQEPKPEFDHIIPHSEGGNFTVENIRLLCHECHLARTREWHKTRKQKAKS